MYDMKFYTSNKIQMSKCFTQMRANLQPHVALLYGSMQYRPTLNLRVQVMPEKE